MIGTEDLTAQTIGTLHVQQLERRNPELAWRCACTLCGTQQVILHRKFQTGAATCGNTCCGKIRTKPSSSSGAEVVQIQTAVRSRDSAEAREFLKRAQMQQSSRYATPEEIELWRRAVIP